MREANRIRFLREARATGSVTHPNVVSVFDVGEHHGGLYLVMEYIEGEPFSRLLAREISLSPKHALEILLPAMQGVAAAHAQGIVHRDLKPDNIILAQGPHGLSPKVVDFGVAKAFGPSSVDQSTLTETGALIGTPHYMAIEQIDGTGDVDARTDVYAFGVILYQVLAGHLPYRGDTLGSIILQIGTRTPEPLHKLSPSIPEALSQVVQRALARDKNARYESLDELARALSPFTAIDTKDVPKPPPSSAAQIIAFDTTSAGQLARPPRMPSWMLVAGIAVLMALTAWVARTIP